MGGTNQLAAPVLAAKKSMHKQTNLSEELIRSAQVSETQDFDPATHLAFEPPSKISTFEDLGLGNVGISPNAVSEPFPLFSEEAVRQMRAEIFSPNVVDRFHCQNGPSTGHVRGHCPEYAPFIWNAWNSPELLKIVSDVAGVELVPAVPHDVGHCNISVNKKDDEVGEVVAPGEQKDQKVNGYCESSFGWHTDSYPFVVVTMLSDCEGMVGGETAIRTGDGRVVKARGPKLGTAVVMQGMYVPHQATAALGGRERISMVTSFRPKNPHTTDGTVLRGVRNISHLPTIYSQYAEYRLENLEERVRTELRSVRKQRAGKRFDTKATRRWLLQQKDYIDAMLEELRAE